MLSGAVTIQTLPGRKGGEALTLENGCLTWQIYLTGIYRGTGLRGASDNWIIGGRTTRMPAGYYTTISDVLNNYKDRCFWLGGNDLIQSYKILENTQYISKVRVIYTQKEHRADVEYLTYIGDNKIFVTVNWTPLTDNAARLKSFLADNLIVPGQGEYSEYILARQDKKIVAYDCFKDLPSQWNIADINTQEINVLFVETRSLDTGKVAGVITDIATQPKYLDWLIVKSPQNQYVTMRCGVRRQLVRKGNTYSVSFIFVSDVSDNFNVVENTYKAYAVNGRLRGAIKKIGESEYIWTNPLRAKNIRVCSCIPLTADMKKISDIVLEKGSKLVSWWVQNQTIYILADIHDKLHIHIK